MPSMKALRTNCRAPAIEACSGAAAAASTNSRSRSGIRPELFSTPRSAAPARSGTGSRRRSTEPGPERLRSDLESGRWDEKYGHLRTLPELDIGLRLACEEL